MYKIMDASYDKASDILQAALIDKLNEFAAAKSNDPDAPAPYSLSSFDTCHLQELLNMQSGCAYERGFFDFDDTAISASLAFLENLFCEVYGCLGLNRAIIKAMFDGANRHILGTHIAPTLVWLVKAIDKRDFGLYTSSFSDEQEIIHKDMSTFEISAFVEGYGETLFAVKNTNCVLYAESTDSQLIYSISKAYIRAQFVGVMFSNQSLDVTNLYECTKAYLKMRLIGSRDDYLGFVISLMNYSLADNPKLSRNNMVLSNINLLPDFYFAENAEKLVDKAFEIMETIEGINAAFVEQLHNDVYVPLVKEYNLWIEVVSDIDSSK